MAHRLVAKVEALAQGLRTLHVASCQAGGQQGSVDGRKNAGIAFVESIFGRDRELEKTVKLMNGVRL